MKPKHWWLSVGGSCALMVMASILPNRSIDTRPLERQFLAADSAAQARAHQAALAIQATDYARALEQLHKIFLDPKITPEQRCVIRTLASRVERTMIRHGEAPPPKATSPREHPQLADY